MIILDTCAVLWLAEGSARLSSETVAVSKIQKWKVITTDAPRRVVGAVHPIPVQEK